MKTSRLRQLTTLLHAMDIQPILQDREDRRSVHAQIYLAQELGFDAGYGFQWTPRGPYSSSLTDELYDLTGGPSGIIPYTLNADSLARARRIKKSILKPHDVNLSDGKWYLLLASLHFLMKYTRPPAEEVRRKIRNIDSALERYHHEASRILEAA